jgi:hypothetical protein
MLTIIPEDPDAYFVWFLALLFAMTITWLAVMIRLASKPVRRVGLEPIQWMRKAERFPKKNRFES